MIKMIRPLLKVQERKKRSKAASIKSKTRLKLQIPVMIKKNFRSG